MKIVGVAIPGGTPVFSRTLAHGADPHRVAWELGFRIQRPLSVVGRGDELALTVLVTPHQRSVAVLPPQRIRSMDPGLRLDRGVTPVRRQRIAAYAIVVSSAGLLATEFSDRTAVPGLWGLPGGGIDPDEVPAQAVQREVFEETGQDIELVCLLDLQTDHWIGRAPSGAIEDFHAVRIIYAALCPEPSEPVVHDAGGTTASTRWVEAAHWADLPWATGVRTLLERHLPRLLG
ncbi:MAG: NUDIX domain-containing protein [Propionibacteriaceae bacterium]